MSGVQDARVNYIPEITTARQANDTNENRAEWPQRIVILITAGALFSRWIYVRNVTQSLARRCHQAVYRMCSDAWACWPAFLKCKFYAYVRIFAMFPR